MNDESKKDLLMGMLLALAGAYESHFNESEKKAFERILKEIDKIYYPEKDLSKPSLRGL